MYKRASWTESFVQWSPHGNYLATVHRQGVVVWGGASWQRLARFSHPGYARHTVRGQTNRLRADQCECADAAHGMVGA